MDDFRTFKASRQKIDPTTRHFSDDQWDEAYSAYKQSRKRLSKGRDGAVESSSRRRKKVSAGRSKRSKSDVPPRVAGSRGSSGDASNHRSVGSLANKLRAEIRRDSAYRDLRLAINVMTWAAIALIVFSVVVKWFYYTDGSVALDAGLSGAVEVILVFLLRVLSGVIIDIQDNALHKRISEHLNEK